MAAQHMFRRLCVSLFTHSNVLWLQIKSQSNLLLVVDTYYCITLFVINIHRWNSWKKKHQSIHDSFIQMYSVYLRVFHVDFSWNCLFFSSVFSVLLSQKLFLKEIKRKGEGDNTANLFHLLYWMWNVTLQLV